MRFDSNWGKTRGDVCSRFRKDGSSKFGMTLISVAISTISISWYENGTQEAHTTEDGRRRDNRGKQRSSLFRLKINTHQRYVWWRSTNVNREDLLGPGSKIGIVYGSNLWAKGAEFPHPAEYRIHKKKKWDQAANMDPWHYREGCCAHMMVSVGGRGVLLHMAPCEQHRKAGWAVRARVDGREGRRRDGDRKREK